MEYFFTPKSLVKMIVNILEPTSGVLSRSGLRGQVECFVQTGDFCKTKQDYKQTAV